MKHWRPRLKFPPKHLKPATAGSSLCVFPSDHPQYRQGLLTGSHLVSPTPSWVDAIGLCRAEVPVRCVRVSSSSLSRGIDLAVMLWQGHTLTYGLYVHSQTPGHTQWITMNMTSLFFCRFMSLHVSSLCYFVALGCQPALVQFDHLVTGPLIVTFDTI